MESLFALPFDKPLKGVGAVRTWSGFVCAAVLCRAMGWKETGTGNADKGECVPDAWSDSYPVEIKGVTLSGFQGKSVIYKFRIEKERRAFPNLVYAFIGHLKLGTPKTLASLHERLSNHAWEVVLVPALAVYDFIEKNCDLKPVKSWKVNAPDYQKIGYNREGYADGYYCPNVRQWFKGASAPQAMATTHEGRNFTLNIYAYERGEEKENEAMRNKALPEQHRQKKQIHHVREMHNAKISGAKSTRLLSPKASEQRETARP